MISESLLNEVHAFIGKVAIQLAITHQTSFYASVLMCLKREYSETITQTACVTLDGRLVLNPHFIKNEVMSHDKGIDMGKFVLMHEICHIAYDHLDESRLADHEPKKWNYATDYAINRDLKEADIPLLDGVLYDRKYNDLSAEQIYKALLDEPKDHANPMGTDLLDGLAQSEGDNSSDGSDGMTEAQKQEALNNMRDMVLGAATQHAMHNGNDMSTLPSAVRDLIHKITNPTIPWNVLLKRYMRDVSKEDYSWRKPNKRMLHEVYLPSLHSQAMSRVDLCIDVSGSISQEEFNIFVSEAYGIMKHMRPKEIGISQFNHGHLGTDRVKSLQDFNKIEFKGGGGTNIEDTLNALRNVSTKAIIILTDGYLNTALLQPKVPVIWCVYDHADFKPQWGQVVHFDLEALKRVA